jgi:hypothetical protein
MLVVGKAKMGREEDISMKKNFLVVFALVLSCIVPAYALDNVRVNIPFDFIAGGKTLPAGEYTIMQSGQQGVTVIRDLDGGAAVFAASAYAKRLVIPEVLTQWSTSTTSAGHESNYMNNLRPAKRSLENSVVFHRYGDRCFISQVWTGLSGREFPLSSTEREIKTARTSNRETVVLAAGIH